MANVYATAASPVLTALKSPAPVTATTRGAVLTDNAFAMTVSLARTAQKRLVLTTAATVGSA